MNFLLHISILDKLGKRMEIWPKYNIGNSNFHDTKLVIRIVKYCDLHISVFFQVSDYINRPQRSCLRCFIFSGIVWDKEYVSVLIFKEIFLNKTQ